MIFDFFGIREREQYWREERARKFALGAALGAAAGILFAPQSGKKTREEIAERSKDYAENAKDFRRAEKEARVKDFTRLLLTTGTVCPILNSGVKSPFPTIPKRVDPEG